MTPDLSIKGAVWRPRLQSGAQDIAREIAAKAGCNDLVARVIAARGATPASARTWLDPKIRDLMTDPSDFADMPNAIDRIARAIASGEQIAIFGDYDVDGASSTALLVRYLDLAGARPPLFYIPDRVFEGYGLNAGAVRHLAGRGATLLISVDCGTTAHAELALAKDMGLDTIVIDHHEPDDTLPCGLIVNPKRIDDLSGEQALCAAGVVFLLLAGLNRELRARGYFEASGGREPDLRALLHLVALATIADVAPLTGLNRAMVRAGLKILETDPGPGLASLMELSETRKPLKPQSIGFQLGPRLNAGGRLGNSMAATLLLLTRDPSQAQALARELDALNSERRALEQEAVAASIAVIEAQKRDIGLGPAIFAVGVNWHQGVAGLIASRLAEAYQRPAFAITFQGDMGVGSARSGGTADIGLIVKEAAAAGIITRGGGHAAAAGLALTRQELAPFEAFVADRLAASGALTAGPPIAYHDGPIQGATPRELLETIEALEAAGPYGQSNPEPSFVLEDVVVTQPAVVGGAHFKFVAHSSKRPFALAAIAFRAEGTAMGAFLADCAKSRAPVRLLVSAEINEFRGQRIPQARILDAALQTVDEESFLRQ